MIKIAILSNLKNSIILKGCIESSAVRSNIKADFTIYLDYCHLCEDVREETFYNIFFLDIDIMPNKALQVSHIICENIIYEKTKFIFISKHKERIEKFLQFDPIDYFLKPLNCIQTDMIIKKYIIENKLYTSFVYKKNNIECRIPVPRIIYLHEFRENVILHTDEFNIELEGSLSEYLSKDCFNDFILTDKNIIVNPAYVEQIDHDFLIISNDVRLPIKQNAMKKIKI